MRSGNGDTIKFFQPPIIKSKLVKTESTSSESPHQLVENSTKKFKNHTKHLIITVPIILTIIIAITIAGVILTKHKGEGEAHHPDNPDNGQLKPRLIDRDEWGGRPPLNFTRPLRHPTPLVIISHTVSTFCTNIKDCSERVLSAQQYHVGSFHSPDIGYNFLIGGDGNIYIGRGWDIRNFHQDNSIGISFIGNFLYDELTDEMIDAVKFLLNSGVDMQKLSKDYTLVCHNQTFATQSPGPNVYKIVKNWPNFKPITIR